MANRSTVTRTLPRDLTKLAALSKAPTDFKKRMLLPIEPPKGKEPKRTDEGDVQVWQILPDYDRMLRLLMKEAHQTWKRAKMVRMKTQGEHSLPDAKVAPVGPTA